MDKSINTNEAPAQQVYIIQFDHNINVQYESQAIPLHVLENNLDPELILPLLQQKHGEPLQSNIHTDPVAPSAVVNSVNLKEHQNLTPNSELFKQNIRVTLPAATKKGPIETTSEVTNLNAEFTRNEQKIKSHEPHEELTDTLINNSQRLRDKIPTNQINPIAPLAVDNTINQGAHPNLIHYSQNTRIPLTLPVAVKIEPVETSSKESNFNDKTTMIIDRTLKQKIKNYVHISDTKAPPRAVAVLPAALHFRGKSIFPRRTLSSRIRFGPVIGIRKIITRSEANQLVSSSTTPIFLLNHDEDHVVHIAVADKDKSNWMGLLSLGEVTTPATPTTANVWLYEESNELYALTVQSITVRTPLKLGFSKKYFEDHIRHINNEQPVLDLETVNAVQWWCNECNRALQSAALLQRHTDVYHKDTIKSGWSSYRCKYCRRIFGRMFTLKRHMLAFCTKRPNKSPEKWHELTESNPEPDISAALEDNRIPSDESFQNFTNSLDFSTNLFDTDRIALDISAHSRADSEPNDLHPYGIGFRDDNGLSNDLGFSKLANLSELVQFNEVNQEKKTPILDTCSYCNQVVVKESKSKHLRQCPSRLICECGRVFRHMKSLAIHVHKSHPNTQILKPDKNNTKEDKETAYNCQECAIGFKRRGMLVNHLWRIHKTISTMPVEKKVKHYPCVACPKIYRSATKRNRHVRVHHPGAEKLRGQSIEGGVKSYQPASCTECPRQYATRAKLLQHIRAHHPHLAKAINKEKIEKKAKTKAKSNFDIREATERPLATEIQPQFEFD